MIPYIVIQYDNPFKVKSKKKHFINTIMIQYRLSLHSII